MATWSPIQFFLILGINWGGRYDNAVCCWGCCSSVSASLWVVEELNHNNYAQWIIIVIVYLGCLLSLCTEQHSRIISSKSAPPTPPPQHCGLHFEEYIYSATAHWGEEEQEKWYRVPAHSIVNAILSISCYVCPCVLRIRADAILLILQSACDGEVE